MIINNIKYKRSPTVAEWNPKMTKEQFSLQGYTFVILVTNSSLLWHSEINYKLCFYILSISESDFLVL